MKSLPRVALLIETSREFGRAFLHGVARHARTHGPWIFYKEPGGLERSLPKLKNWNPTGVMMRSYNIPEAMKQLDVPTIFVIHHQLENSKYPTVVTDSKAIADKAVGHFLDRGYKNFAFCGFDDMPWSQQRGHCFQKQLRKTGYKVWMYQQPKTRVKQRWENEQAILTEWLKSLPKPMAIMACNDDRGQHVIEACKSVNIKVPEDVAVLGVDNDVLICDLCQPALSSIALNTEKAGFEATDLLDRLMQGEKMAGQQIVVKPTHVVTRASTDILNIKDSQVAQALIFIRDNAKRPINVEDVVNAVPSSRRVLEKRFRKTLNRSVLEEIRKARTEQAARMLIETKIPISEIALKLGYTESAHLSRYFRREKDISPIEYRRKYSLR